MVKETQIFKHKKMVTIVVCLFFLFPLTQGYSQDLANSSEMVSQPQRPTIILSEAKGGGELDIVIKNIGQINYHDLEVTTMIDGGIVFSSREHSHEVPFLGGGTDFNQWKISERIIGFGMGLLGSTPTVSVMVQYGGVQYQLGTIQLSLFGLFVRVKQVFSYDENTYEGYTLFTPEYGTNTFLIDNQGSIVHSWLGDYIQGMGTYLMENGNLIRADMKTLNTIFRLGGVTGHVGIYAPDGSVLWDYDHSANEYCLHHDIEVLPNGNVLMISWEYKSEQEAIQAGKDPAKIRDGKIFPCYILEVKPTGLTEGEIVWEWHAWDHIIQDFDPSKDHYGVVEDHPELIDINYETAVSSGSDWTHINSIDYHEDFDQILLSVRNLHEIWVIDHSTATEEAAGSTGGRYGKGGDLLYRWGNPATYRAGTESDQQLFRHHDANWIESGSPGEGNILIFNNARVDDMNPNIQYSTVDEITPPVNAQGQYMKVGSAFGPFDYEWQYIAENPPDFSSNILSGAQRLPNGNTLICNGGKGYFFEVTPEKGLVWQYQNHIVTPDDIFKVRKYDPDYPGVVTLLSN
jgi:hypothetical protein